MEKTFFSRLFERKSTVSQAHFLNIGDHQPSMESWESFAKEGYRDNSTVYRCISMIASNAASITPYVYVNGEREEGHPLEELLNKPNIDEGGVEFRTASFSWMLLTGNCFTSRDVNSEGMPSELWNWQPYNMKIGHAKNNPKVPAQYKWSARDYVKRWDVDPLTGQSDMLHWRTFNPATCNSFYGQAPLSAGAMAGDQLNAANKWRYNVLKNDCRPSGILSTKADVDSGQRKELAKQLEEDHMGFTNPSRFIIAGGGEIKWEQLGMNPKDADWLDGSKHNKQELAEVFGVPTQLLGIEGAQTYANYEEARLAFWVETIIPLMDLYFSELNRWLSPLYGGNVELRYDENEITALNVIRQKKLQTCLDSDVLTINEKRAILGYPIDDNPEADSLFIDASKIPLGIDTFTEDESGAKELAQALMRMGHRRIDAEQKAMDLLLDGKCQH